MKCLKSLDTIGPDKGVLIVEVPLCQEVKKYTNMILGEEGVLTAGVVLSKPSALIFGSGRAKVLLRVRKPVRYESTTESVDPYS